MKMEKEIWELVKEHCSEKVDNPKDDSNVPVTLEKAKKISKDIHDLLYYGLTAKELSTE